MLTNELFSAPQDGASRLIQILGECDAGLHPEGNGITDTRGNVRCLASMALEQCRDEIEPETVQALLEAAELRITRRGKVRYGK